MGQEDAYAIPTRKHAIILTAGIAIMKARQPNTVQTSKGRISDLQGAYFYTDIQTEGGGGET